MDLVSWNLAQYGIANLLPVVIRREVTMQIILLSIILCTFMVLQQAGQPWRSLPNNLFDGATRCTLGTLLVVAGMAGGMQVNKEVLKILEMIV